MALEIGMTGIALVIGMTGMAGNDSRTGWSGGKKAEKRTVVEELVQGPEDVRAGPEDDWEGLARREAEAGLGGF